MSTPLQPQHQTHKQNININQTQHQNDVLHSQRRHVPSTNIKLKDQAQDQKATQKDVLHSQRRHVPTTNIKLKDQGQDQKATQQDVLHSQRRHVATTNIKLKDKAKDQKAIPKDVLHSQRRHVQSTNIKRKDAWKEFVMRMYQKLKPQKPCSDLHECIMFVVGTLEWVSLEEVHLSDDQMQSSIVGIADYIRYHPKKIYQNGDILNASCTNGFESKSNVAEWVYAME
eukprot:448466_1